MNPITFLKEVQLELYKVTWPTRAETIRLTVLVILISVFVGLFITGLDYGFVTLIQAILNK